MYLATGKCLQVTQSLSSMVSFLFWYELNRKCSICPCLLCWCGGIFSCRHARCSDATVWRNTLKWHDSSEVYCLFETGECFFCWSCSGIMFYLILSDCGKLNFIYWEVTKYLGLFMSKQPDPNNSWSKSNCVTTRGAETRSSRTMN